MFRVKGGGATPSGVDANAGAGSLWRPPIKGVCLLWSAPIKWVCLPLRLLRRSPREWIAHGCLVSSFELLPTLPGLRTANERTHARNIRLKRFTRLWIVGAWR